jgi:hypothetical protein
MTYHSSGGPPGAGGTTLLLRAGDLDASLAAVRAAIAGAGVISSRHHVS